MWSMFCGSNKYDRLQLVCLDPILISHKITLLRGTVPDLDKARGHQDGYTDRCKIDKK